MHPPSIHPSFYHPSICVLPIHPLVNHPPITRNNQVLNLIQMHTIIKQIIKNIKKYEKAPWRTGLIYIYIDIHICMYTCVQVCTIPSRHVMKTYVKYVECVLDVSDVT